MSETFEELAAANENESTEAKRVILVPSVGSFTGVKSMLPMPSLPQNCSAEVLEERNSELTQAQIDNYYNDTVLPGAVVHGNMYSDDVNNNINWNLRGTDEERATMAQEDDFGVDDADPGEDAIDLAEPVVSYVQKHWTALLLSGGFFNAANQLFKIIYKNIGDNLGKPLSDLSFKLEIIDPVLAFIPARRARNVEELNFFPDNDRFPHPAYDEEFRDDDVMGWLQVAPVSPDFDQFSPYTEHLEKFPVSNAMFRKQDGFGDDDLDQAMNEGRVFITDYAGYNDECTAPSTDDGYGAKLHAAMALFAVPKGGDSLKIIAIQPTQTPAANSLQMIFQEIGLGDKTNPVSQILTPKDDYWSWQMAKNVFTSMTSMSAVLDHLGGHVYLGPIPVAFYRTISDHHPLTALLETHFMSLIDNNFLGIFNEVGTGSFGIPTEGEFHGKDFGDPLNGLLTGAIERLSGFSSESFLAGTLKRAGRFHFVRDSTPLDRSTDTKFETLGEYPFHDDNRTFTVIQEWVSNYLSLYYSSDTDVIEDTELQNFFWEVANEGKVNGFPESCYSLEEMVDTITRLIYWMSVNHALDRFPSFMKLGALGYYDKNLPRPRGWFDGRSEKDWFNAMPPINVGLGLFVFSRIFVDLPRDWHRSLGKYPQGQFMHDQRVYQHLSKFQNDMKSLDSEIRQTNENRRWSCELRMPSTLTVSPWN